MHLTESEFRMETLSVKSSAHKGGILLVANWPSDVGYAWWLMESFWAAIARHCEAQYSSIVAFPQLNAIPEVLQQAPIESIEHNFQASSIQQVLDNCRLIRKHQIKIIYLSDYPMSALQYMAYRVCGVKTIISHDHTPGLRAKAKGIIRVLKAIRSNFPFASVDAGFGATSFVTERLRDTYCLKKAKCFTVQNGIDVSQLETQADLRPDWLPKFDQGEFVIITAARANHYKGITFALEVIAELVQRGHRHVKFVFCGDGPHLEEFKQFANELGVDEHCVFPGRVSQLNAAFKLCELGFQPSQGEVGYSLSIIEYMYAGLPVVVPDNPSVCAATEDQKTGCIYSEGDVLSAANKIEWYIHNPDGLRAQGSNAISTVKAHYTLKRTHEALIRAFDVATQ